MTEAGTGVVAETNKVVCGTCMPALAVEARIRASRESAKWCRMFACTVNLLCEESLRNRYLQECVLQPSQAISRCIIMITAWSVCALHMWTATKHDIDQHKR